MRKIVIFLLLFFVAAFGKAQTEANCFRVYLHDKAESPFSVERPQDFLSHRAIEKRSRFGIAVLEEDLPVNPSYRSGIVAISDSIRILSVSKWMNTVTVYCPEEADLQSIMELPFVDSIRAVGFYQGMVDRVLHYQHHESSLEVGVNDTLYGVGEPQIALHNGQLLHAEGYRGEGMLIAMLDAGWTGFDESSYFQQLYENGQIWGTYNLVPGFGNDVYCGHSHGTSCASIILSSIISGWDTLVGTAPKANMVFIRTEDPDYEQLIEEDFWVNGAELADSLGADVITSSLGYTDFDGQFDYSSCDGITSLASRAATKAAHKGMVVCIAAGNDGANEWHKLSRPADAEDVLCVGAVNADSIYAPFSSCGPSFDGRVKPDVASCGWNTFVVYIWNDDENQEWHDYIVSGNGTSFATPDLAGLATCLWQALPQLNSLEVMQIIREAGHQFATPDTLMGYGIPNFYQAWLDHRTDTVISVQESYLPHSTFHLYPNPCQSTLTIENPDGVHINICIYDLMGRVMYADGDFSGEGERVLNTGSWPSGVYFARIQRRTGNAEILKFVRE